MPDSKITALTNLTAADAINDMLPIVDVSDNFITASGTTKRISVNNLLSSSPTASGALTVTGLVTAGSATITGDLTAARWLITGGTLPGVGNAYPFAYRIGGGGLGIGAATETGTTAPIVFYCGAGGVEQYRIAPLGVFTWADGAGGTRMTLNSTGLALGMSISSPWATNRRVLQIGGTNSGAIALTGTSGSGELFFNSFFNSSSQNICVVTGGTGKYDFNVSTVGCHTWNIGTGTAGTAFTFTPAMTLDASGNLLVGKTSSLFSTIGVEASQAGFLSLTNSASTNASNNLSLYSTGAAAFRFYVGLGGTVFATNTVISAISDSRLKENVQDIDVGLAAILSLKPRKFDWKTGKGKDIKGDRGFIAQEFETVFPNLVDDWKDPAPEGEAPYKSVRQDLIPVLVKAIQELTARVQTLEAR